MHRILAMLLLALLASCGSKELSKADAERQIKEKLLPATCTIKEIGYFSTDGTETLWLNSLKGLHANGYIDLAASFKPGWMDITEYAVSVKEKLSPFIEGGAKYGSDSIRMRVGEYQPEILMIPEPAPDNGVIVCKVEYAARLDCNEVGKAMGASYEQLVREGLANYRRENEQKKIAWFIKTQDGWKLDKLTSEFK